MKWNERSDSTRKVTRRQFTALQAAAFGHFLLGRSSRKVWAADGKLEIATFHADVSPPQGHPLCGGWIAPVSGQDDPLEAVGIVIRGAGAPIVLCAVDWTGILNEAHIRWREELARVAATSPDRVAIQCVHQHNAPFVCLESQRTCARFESLRNAVVHLEYFDDCVRKTAAALQRSLKEARPLTQVATGKAVVERVASNRRFVGPDGKISDWRGSSSRNPVHQELPEGLIDPELRTVAFYDGNRRVAACHYYATHPMSYYGDGRVSSDFAGLARKRLQQADPDCLHLYFTGCAGNIAAGKYNDGTPQARRELTDRVFAALESSIGKLEPRPVRSLSWRTQELVPQPRVSFAAEMLSNDIAREDNSMANRIRGSMMLSWLKRCEARVPMVLSALHLDDTALLHLPAESFIEYQLRAQQVAPTRFVATAAYGDCGPWYIPIKEAYPQGGYEVGVAFCEPTIDEILVQGIRQLLV